MLQEKERQEARSNLYDSESVYGWISILLHWLTAIVIIVLWFIGKSIMNVASEHTDAQRQLHVSVAASAWLIVVVRIIWRFRSGHPHVKGQTMRIHSIAKIIHYAMMIVVALMLLSGPLTIWSGGHPISVFGWFSIPGPIGQSESVGELSRLVHASFSMLLLWLVLLHFGGALKHLMFHADDTIARMLWPGRRNDSATDR